MGETADDGVLAAMHDAMRRDLGDAFPAGFIAQRMGAPIGRVNAALRRLLRDGRIVDVTEEGAYSKRVYRPTEPAR